MEEKEHGLMIEGPAFYLMEVLKTLQEKVLFVYFFHAFSNTCNISDHN